MARERVELGAAPVLATERLSAAYGAHAVLRGVSFSVRAGEVVAVSGSNGAGKSTLLRCAAGLIPFRGGARVAGLDVGSGREVRRLVGYLPQAVSLPEHATVGEVLAFFARLRRAAADDVGLPEGFLPEADRRIGILSGGQRQRVALAVALLGEPSLLVLDEPVANLDGPGRDVFWRALRGRAERGAAALIATPTPSDLVGVAGRAIVLDDGLVAFDGPMHGPHALPDLDPGDASPAEAPASTSREGAP